MLAALEHTVSEKDEALRSCAEEAAKKQETITVCLPIHLYSLPFPRASSVFVSLWLSMCRLPDGLALKCLNDGDLVESLLPLERSFTLHTADVRSHSATMLQRLLLLTH